MRLIAVGAVNFSLDLIDNILLFSIIKRKIIINFGKK